MFEFFRRKNAQEPTPDEEQKALPETTGDGEGTPDDEVLKDAVEAMLVSQADGEVDDDPIPEPELEAGSSINVIGADTKIGGAIETQSPVHVLGEVEGNINCTSVTVDDDGIVRGDIVASGDVSIRGKVLGNMAVDGKLTITSKGSVTGSVKARAIAIEEGGELRGRCSMSTSSNLSVVSAS